MPDAVADAAADALRLEEAVPLGYAVLARLAEDHDVRLLAIKGPVLHLQGLRVERTSVDIDVLVDPAGFDRMREALEAIGWYDGGFYDTPGIVPIHSVNHRHPRWPCEVDLHHWFPGFLADPGEVFDVLWRRRTSVVLANAPVPTPDPVAHAALAALHYLRDQTTPWGREKLETLAAAVTASWTAEQVHDLAELAADTGAADTLRPFLDLVGAPRVAPVRALVVPLDDWEMRSLTSTRQVLPWLVGLRRTPWHRRPSFMIRALWLGDQQFRSWDTTLPGSRSALMRARWRRVRRAVRALPAARAELKRRDGVTRGRG